MMAFKKEQTFMVDIILNGDCEVDDDGFDEADMNVTWPFPFLSY